MATLARNPSTKDVGPRRRPGLPRGTAVQPTREEEHMEVLTRYVADQERHPALTLHLVEEARTQRSTPYEAVEVRLMGDALAC